MGAAHSTEPRSVSMDNPNPGVIDVSDEVVQRLKKGISKQAKENASSSSESKTPKPEVQRVQVKPAPPPAAVPPTVVYQSPPTVYVAPSGTTITAADMARQKEAELKQNDAMWRQRLTDLEQTLKKTNAIMEKEYSSAVEDVRQRFATASAVHQLPPCQDLKAQVIACYRANPGQTLKCSSEVAAFRECINLNRIKKLDVEESKNVAKAA
ncbi:MICOS complex subunit MIC19 [Ceratitis capitata]|uniref:Coiled-coil-helix-coiled-coil-helix domain-containing protein 3, mitochondrial n=1 Tax=Ceratitis capitata TaxID=7213 RepID=W8CC46_CERCA|nr:MICOS complex subunit MIC19 [Ceratitis capitata]